METEISQIDGVTVITLGRSFEVLDQAAVGKLKGDIMGTAETIDPPLLVLDIPHTTVAGTPFFSMAFGVWSQLKTRDGRFAISGVTPFCKGVLAVSGLDRLWNVFDTKEQAIAALAGKLNAAESLTHSGRGPIDPEELI